MLKITAIGNLTNDVELKMNETTGKPYAILRIASDRRYKDKDGNKLTDFISEPERQPGFLIKASEVEFLSPRKVEETAQKLEDESVREVAA